MPAAETIVQEAAGRGIGYMAEAGELVLDGVSRIARGLRFISGEETVPTDLIIGDYDV